MAEAIVVKVRVPAGGRWYDHPILRSVLEPSWTAGARLPRAAAEDQTISGDSVQQAKTVAGTLITVPLRTIDVATTLTVLLPDITFAKPSGREVVVPPSISNRCHYNHPGDPHSAVEH